MSSRWRRKKYVKMTWNDAQGHKKGHIKNQSHTPVHPWWKESLCWPPFYIFMERQKKNISKNHVFLTCLSIFWSVKFGCLLLALTWFQRFSTSVALTSFGVSFIYGLSDILPSVIFKKTSLNRLEKNPYSRRKKMKNFGKKRVSSAFRNKFNQWS